jgi:hypothetical protein
MTAERTLPREKRSAAAPPPLARPLLVWCVVMAGLLAVGAVHSLTGPRWAMPEIYLIRQDMPALALTFFLGGLFLLPDRRLNLPRVAPDWRTAGALALAVVGLSWAFAWIVQAGQPFSTDEILARFDATVFAEGKLVAPLPPEWRPYHHGMQPQFALPLAGHAYWISSYLPVNAAFLALASKVGAVTLMPPVWAGLGVLATFGVARRLWPERPQAALLAAVLLATSPQLLITAGTPYAMSAHLALNMTWLWLVLRGGRLGHGLAAVVALLATGLHQIVFHPLFAAPFVLNMWLERRWTAALWHTCAYAAIGLLWSAYPVMLLQTYGAASLEAAKEQMGLLGRILGLLGAYDPGAPGLMAKNLIRFVTWQNLLTAPLAFVALLPALRAGGVLRAMVLGVVLTILAVLVLLPYQGHGWGYRYLHGLQGSVCILAALGWMRLREGRAPAQSSGATALAVLMAVSVLVLLPLRAWQAQQMVHPYLLAQRAIRAIDAEVVIVNPATLWFGADLVRNDPFLRDGPVKMSALHITSARALELCRRYDVKWFMPEEAIALGVPFSNSGEPAVGATQLAPGACAAAHPPRVTRP